MTITMLNLLQSLVTQGTSLPEPVALLFVGTLMICLGNLQRGSLQRRAASLIKVAETSNI
jgi:hypothetical protein